MKTDSDLKDFKNKVLTAIEEFKRKRQKDNQNENGSREKPDKKQPVSSESPKKGNLTPDKSQEKKKSYLDLVAEIKKLEKRAQVLKNKHNRTLEEDAELEKNENELSALKEELKKYSTNQIRGSNSKLSNGFPTGWVVGIIIILIVVGGAMVLIAKRKVKK